jgi:hypothetical protein
MEKNTNKDIAVFAFARGTQIHSNITGSESYKFVEQVINSMMSRNGVDTPKVGISGTKEDVISFIAGLIEYKIMYNIKLEYMEIDSSEFDPDVNPEIYDGKAEITS